MPDQPNILGDGNIQVKYGPEMENIYPFLTTLSGEKRVLFVTTSNRSEYIEGLGEKPKSTLVAEHMAKLLEEKGVEVQIIDAAKLKIHNCLGCVSELHGNMCGSKKAKVKDEKKNPHGHLRCWASVDYPDDEIWRIANAIYDSTAVVFFASQRWGNPNAIYQKVIERLDWIENIHYTYGEPSTIKGKKAGFILLGQNWRVQESIETQQQVLSYFGFDTPSELYMGWQYTRDAEDESEESYKEAPLTFEQSWGIEIPEEKKEKKLKESEGFKVVQVSNFDSFISKLNWK
jgi:multimeric flavodoxin WrbA